MEDPEIIDSNHEQYAELWGRCVKPGCGAKAVGHGLKVTPLPDGGIFVHGNMFACFEHSSEWLLNNPQVTHAHIATEVCRIGSPRGVVFDADRNECRANWDVVGDQLVKEIYEGLARG